MKHPVRFKAITTHPQFRGIYALADDGALWQMTLDGHQWTMVPPPFVESKDEPAPAAKPAAPQHKKSLYA